MAPISFIRTVTCFVSHTQLGASDQFSSHALQVCRASLVANRARDPRLCAAFGKKLIPLVVFDNDDDDTCS